MCVCVCVVDIETLGTVYISEHRLEYCFRVWRCQDCWVWSGCRVGVEGRK